MQEFLEQPYCLPFHGTVYTGVPRPALYGRMPALQLCSCAKHCLNPSWLQNTLTESPPLASYAGMRCVTGPEGENFALLA